jgi:4-amino-4-deoxy-L-arabinose transferase-like glycosyltransferase
MLELAIVLAVAMAAAAAVLLATGPHGPRVSTDSVLYLSTADSLRDTQELRWYSGDPLTQFPPGYPAALAVAGKVAGTSVLGARTLNALCLALIVLLGWMLLRRHAGSRALRLTGAVGLASAPTLFVISSAAWSEPSFVVLVLATVLALEMAIERPGGWHWPVAAGLLASGAFFVRYAGLWLIAAGTLILLLGGRRPPIRERVRRVTLFAIAASFVPALVIERNLLLTDHPLSPRGDVGTPFDEILSDTTDEIGRWLLPEDAAAVVRAVLLVALIAAAGALVIRMRSKPRDLTPPPQRAPLWPLALLVSSYIAFLVASADSVSLEIGPRLLSPAFALGVILVIGGVDRLVAGRRQRDLFMVAGTVVATAWLVAQAQATKTVFEGIRNDGAGWSESTWRNSPLLELIRRRAITPTYVNHADALYFHTGIRGSCWPTATPSVCSGRVPNLELLKGPEPAYLAWFAGTGEARPYVSSALKRKVQLRLVARVEDGQLYRVSAR